MASQSTDLVLTDKVKAFEKAAAELIVYSEQKYGNKNNRKKNQSYQEKMEKAFKLFSRLAEGQGTTEYGSEPYTGPETLEKYKMAVAEGWGGKKEAEGSVKTITAAEVEQGNNDRERRQADLAERRQQGLLLAAETKRLAIEQGQHNDEDEPDADDIVEQALSGKRPKGRPAMVNSTYKPLFANGGNTIQRRIAPDASRRGPDLDDYNGHQRAILADGDDDEVSKSDMAAKLEKGAAARRAVMADREARQHSQGVSQHYNLADEDEESDDADADVAAAQLAEAARTRASAASRARRQTQLNDDEEDSDDGAQTQTQTQTRRSGKKGGGGMAEMDASDAMLRRSRTQHK